jgi:glycosyltransferase involved in cell wall biosynthesis
MKLLSIICKASPSSGGPIQGIKNWHSYFKKTIHQNDVVTFEDIEDIKDWCYDDSLLIFFLGKSFTPISYNKHLFRFLVKNAFYYDILIIHGIWQYHSICTIIVIKWLKKNRPDLKLPKVYCMPHGMLDPWFQKDKSRKFKAIRNNFYWNIIEKHVVNQVDGMLFTCEQELLLARTSFPGYFPKKEINIGYGIESPPDYTSNFSEAFNNLYPGIKDKKYFLFLSRIDFKKGVDLLIESYKRLSLENPSLPHLVIAGPIDSKYAREMIFLAYDNPKIHFIGMLSGSQKWGALYGCEVFILPSHQENFGIVVAEALACSKPVLISNKINIYREIEAGGAGIVNEDTIEGTISNINHWIKLSLIEQQQMGKAAYLVYNKHFKVNASAENLIKL